MEVDPTTGSRLPEPPEWLGDLAAGSIGGGGGEAPSPEPIPKSVTTKAFLHFVMPTLTTARMFAEVQAGDCIVDMVFPLVRITYAGDTDLVVGTVLDQLTAAGSEASLTSGQEPAEWEEISVATLPNAYAEISGERWVQKQIGKELARSWDVLYADIRLSQVILLTRGR
jgi:hypothetical protein